jgi:hypothetical protein
MRLCPTGGIRMKTRAYTCILGVDVDATSPRAAAEMADQLIATCEGSVVWLVGPEQEVKGKALTRVEVFEGKAMR